MKTETPRGDGGARLCAWCGGPIRQSGIGRARDYCKQGCREMAYRERRTRKLIAEAVAAAAYSSVDERRDPSESSVDEKEIPAQATGPAEVGERLVVDVPAPPVPEQTALEVPGIVPEPKPRRPKGTVSDVFALFKGIQ